MSLDVTTDSTAEYLWVMADRIRFLGGVPGSDLELIDMKWHPAQARPRTSTSLLNSSTSLRAR